MIEGKLGVYDDPSFQAVGQAIADQGLFVGCPLEKFSLTAKDLLLLAYDSGLATNHRVLEVGAGCLRTGIWFIDHLEADNYCAIEPNQRMLNAGKEALLTEKRHNKRPIFDYNDQFDLSVFDRRFDWIVGYSIWSHCALDQIEKMVAQASAMNSRLLFSFAPAHPKRPEYTGAGWTGISHESTTKGIAYHHTGVLLALCQAHGMNPYILPAVTGAQLWLFATPD